jgi:hypothetical protein
MKNANLLSKAEMKKVLGGKEYSGGVELCDESNGTFWHQECYTGGYAIDPETNSYVWVSHVAPDLMTWDMTAPCGGQCGYKNLGHCAQYYSCDGVS